MGAGNVSEFAALCLKASGGRSDTVVKFLQSAIAELSSAGVASDVSKAVPRQAGKAQTDATGCVVPDLAFASPRGRFDVHFCPDGLKLHGKAGEFGPISWADVLHVFKLPKAGKRPAGQPPRAYHMNLALKIPLTVGKQKHTCLVLSADGKKPASDGIFNAIESDAFRSWAARQQDTSISSSASGAAGEAEHVTLTRLFSLGLGMAIEEPDNTVFVAESVQAFHGFEDGALYFLRAGLCFLPKPWIFIPMKDISAIDVCPGRGSGQTLDVQVNCLSGAESPVVFTSVPHEYDSAIFKFAQRVAGHGKRAGESSKNDEDAEDSDYQEEPSDDDVIEVTEDAGPPVKKMCTRHSKNRAKSERLLTLDDLEDDEDEFSENDGELLLDS